MTASMRGKHIELLHIISRAYVIMITYDSDVGSVSNIVAKSE